MGKLKTKKKVRALKIGTTFEDYRRIEIREAKKVLKINFKILKMVIKKIYKISLQKSSKVEFLKTFCYFIVKY